MVNIARWTMRHRRTVVIAWIVAAIGIFAISNAVGKKTASSFTLPGTNSQQAVDLLQSHFPAQAGDADQIVFHAKTGKLTDPARSGGDRGDAEARRHPPPRHERRQPVRNRPARDLP